MLVFFYKFGLNIMIWEIIPGLLWIALFSTSPPPPYPLKDKQKKCCFIIQWSQGREIAFSMFSILNTVFYN